MKTIGDKTRPGRHLGVQVLDHTDGGRSVMITCEGGNVRFQSNLTPTEARELAGHLQNMANEVEACEVREVETDWSAA